MSNSGTDEKIGYRNPPKHRQFKASGNLRGRPRGTPNRKTVIEKIVNERHTINVDGKRRRRSSLELVLMLIRNTAMEGDRRAVRALDELMTRYGHAEVEYRGGYFIMPERDTVEEWTKKVAEHAEEGRRRMEARQITSPERQVRPDHLSRLYGVAERFAPLPLAIGTKWMDDSIAN